MNYGKYPIILFLLTLLFGCVDSTEDQDIPEENSDRKEMLKFWVEEMIIPSYSEFEQDLQNMVISADQFVNNPTESNLQALRNTWVQAYVSWQHVELFEVGPAEKYTLRNFYNIYPTNVSGIETNISSSTLNLNLPSTYDQQGFPALDYLINGVAEEDIKILEFYTDSEKGENRRAYLNTLVTRMELLLNQVTSDWNGPAKEEFISKTGLDIGSSTASMVNAYVLYYERHVRSGKFGIPSGATLASSGTPNPEKIEAYYKQDISLLLAKTAHQAFTDFFNGNANGKQGPSLKTYLVAIGAKDPSTGILLSEYITEQLAVISNLLNGLSENLYQQIITDNDSMIQVYQEMQKAVRILKVDMTSAMSITITYTDNDGD
ncbi:imelysin family protein [Algoriphagus lutimaris]|uniref:imelysin family protein n=1 Tax=Algoriphagus lutimaris TaxID=613197 RepID=UPI00196B893D|nr:imelysin family protein [Algoriphagus lutimaris]MBN3518807.1 imelysin family protein [Algoriphagus lutimaris]